MTCSKCGMPCQGGMCRTCGRAEHQEEYYGVPEDNYDDEDEAVGADDDTKTEHPSSSDSEEWAVVQQGLDGEAHTGQSTLDGGVEKDELGGDD